MYIGDKTWGTKIDRIMRNKFNGLLQVNNFLTHQAGRILILWNPLKVELEGLETSPQVIRCLAKCKVTSYIFHVSLFMLFILLLPEDPFGTTLRNLA